MSPSRGENKKSLKPPPTVDGSEIPNNHSTCIKPCKYWDINTISTGAGFLNHQQYVHYWLSPPCLNQGTGCTRWCHILRCRIVLRWLISLAPEVYTPKHGFWTNIPKNFRYLKWRYWTLQGCFLGMGIPVSISRIHTAYIGEYLYFRYLKCLVKTTTQTKLPLFFEFWMRQLVKFMFRPMNFLVGAMFSSNVFLLKRHVSGLMAVICQRVWRYPVTFFGGLCRQFGELNWTILRRKKKTFTLPNPVLWKYATWRVTFVKTNMLHLKMMAPNTESWTVPGVDFFRWTMLVFRGGF